MKISRFLFKTHQISGLIIAFFIVIIGLTGSLLVFLEEIRVFTQEIKVIEQSGKTLPLQALHDKVQIQEPKAFIKIIEASEDKKAYKFYWHENNQSYIANVNQFSGEILDKRLANSGFTHFVYDLHISLAVSPWGDLAVAIVAILFVISSLTGLWVQRKFIFRVFRIGIRQHKSTKTKHSDTHKLVGSVSLITNLILGSTGIYITLYVYDAEFLSNGHKHSHITDVRPVYNFSLDTLLAESQNRVSEFSLNYVEFPNTSDEPIVFNGRIPYGNFFYTPAYGSSRVEFNATNGDWVTTMDLRKASFVEQLSSFLHEFHYGKFAGLPVKIIYFIGGILPAILAITGSVLWWKKKKTNQNLQLINSK